MFCVVCYVVSLVVFLNDSFHVIVQAGIGDFDGVVVEDFLILVHGGEVFSYTSGE